MTERIFIPGSEWLYFKMYMSYQNIDKVLANNIAPFVQHLKSEGIVDHAFFIRYADPDIHVRLRLHLKELKFTEIFLLFHKQFNELMDNKIIWMIQCDTYKRELERYGHYTIKDIESLFDLDSNLIVDFIQSIGKAENAEEQKFFFSFALIDRFLDICDYDIMQKSDYVHSITEQLLWHLDLYDTKYFKLLNGKYRIYSSQIKCALENNDWTKLLGNYENYAKSILLSIKQNLKYNSSVFTMEELIVSLLHMSLNRLFVSDNKICELASYYMLDKYYCWLLHKKKYEE